MLKNQTVMITGASAGIGAACAESFAREGARLVLAARRLPRLEELAGRLLEAHGAETHLIELDVRDREAVDAAVAGLPAEWAAIDVLVNNAGLSRGLDKVHEGWHVDWEEMIDTNVKGLLWVSRAVLPGMVARDQGHVINLGSVAGRQVYPGGNVRGDSERAAKTYRNFPPLTAADVAEAVLFCATRPPHVAVQDLLIMPQDQAAVDASHPRGLD